MSTIYKVVWENGHASGAFPYTFNSIKEAEKFGREWKKEMVAIEQTPKERRAAKETYQWEVYAAEVKHPTTMMRK